MLTKCNKERNNVDWFESCEKLCDKFDLMKYNEFFAPKLKSYSRYTTYLKKNLDIKEEEQKKADLLRQSTGSRLLAETPEKKSEKTLTKNQLKSQRLLTEKKEKKLTHEEKEKQKALNMNPDDIFKIDHFKKFKDNSIYKSGLNAIVKLEKFKKVFKNVNNDFFMTGKESVITITTYKGAKESKIKELREQQTADEGGEEKVPAPSRTLKETSSVGFNSFVWVFALTLVFFNA